VGRRTMADTEAFQNYLLKDADEAERLLTKVCLQWKRMLEKKGNKIQWVMILQYLMDEIQVIIKKRT
jgi:hypothetical protein